MPVIKTLRACYEVRDGQRCGEWANITLRCAGCGLTFPDYESATDDDEEY
jgi:hypothetical protein